MKRKGQSFEPPVLIVEDDRKHSELLALYLAREGFNTLVAFDGTQALELASTHRLLFTVLDIMLPDMEGWEICRRLRTFSNVPILITSGLNQDHEKIKGLRLGADDYIVKPFSFEELVARIRAILRRATTRPDSQSLSHGDLTMDLSKYEVTRKGRRVALTSSEFKILEVLMATPGRVYPRRELLACLYPSGGVVIDRVIDVHVRQLRKKIEDEPSRPRYVLTSRGIGYRFADNVARVPVTETLRFEPHEDWVEDDCAGAENRV
jgi:DNA-binding response OmpR family regulator